MSPLDVFISTVCVVGFTAPWVWVLGRYKLQDMRADFYNRRWPDPVVQARARTLLDKCNDGDDITDTDRKNARELLTNHGMRLGVAERWACEFVTEW